MKTILIVVDGMRPDDLENIEYVKKIMSESTYSMDAVTVYPSVTLPCHMSLFHSVAPDRHGTTDNIYAPQVRPIRGLCEVLAYADKTSAFFYNWEQLRDLSRPGMLAYSYFASQDQLGYENTNRMVTENAIAYIKENKPDFAFIYLGWVDEAGHKYGWMSSEYMHAMKESWKSIESILEPNLGDYEVIITADHGGHDRHHGSTMKEDMTIPVFLKGKNFEAGKKLDNVSILDIAPTIATLMGVKIPKEWEGKILC